MQLFRERLSDESVKPTRKHRMVVWVFMEFCHWVRKKSTNLCFEREVLVRLHSILKLIRQFLWREQRSQISLFSLVSNYLDVFFLQKHSHANFSQYYNEPWNSFVRQQNREYDLPFYIHIRKPWLLKHIHIPG